MNLENIFSVYNEIPYAAQETGYQMKTTFWGDFRICGTKEHSIKDTYNRAFNEWKDDKIYATELSLVLNWLMWFYSERDVETSKVYQRLWGKLDSYIIDNWKGEKLDYYLSTTD